MGKEMLELFSNFVLSFFTIGGSLLSIAVFCFLFFFNTGKGFTKKVLVAVSLGVVFSILCHAGLITGMVSKTIL